MALPSYVTQAQVEGHLGVNAGTETAARIDELVAGPAAIAEQFSPDAPDAIKRQAILQAAGYIYYGVNAAVERGMLHSDVMRQSGATAMLAPWHQPGFGCIEDSS